MNDCVESAGGHTSSGYGLRTIAGERIYAHRLAYFAAYGSIPTGMIVCHSCDNPPCVNPRHLFLGTDESNSRDKVSKGRQAQAGMMPHSKLNEERVRFIRNSPLRNRDLAQMFNVSHSAISHAKSGKQWSHVK